MRLLRRDKIVAAMAFETSLGCRMTVKNTFVDVGDLCDDDDLSTGGFGRGTTAPAVLQKDPAYVHMDSPDAFQSPTNVETTVLDGVLRKCKAWAGAMSDSNMVLPGLERDSTLTAISNMALSATLADPLLPDCPLIGCSDGFEELTGYSRAEVLGKNCRFLNQGLGIDMKLREQMRRAADGGAEFFGVVTNVRKDGTLFQNYLRLTSLTVRDQVYIVGIQFDATNIQVDVQNARHAMALEVIAKTIFTENLNAWVQMQAREYFMRLPAPCSDILHLGLPSYLTDEQSQFVKIKSAATLPSAPTSLPTTKVKDERASTSSVTQETTTSFTQDEPEPQPGATKSAGSAGHPNECKECTFFFFSAAGCRSGADCAFCHEFHPRKNGKKNRRIIKTLKSRCGSTEEEENCEEKEDDQISHGKISSSSISTSVPVTQQKSGADGEKRVQPSVKPVKSISFTDFPAQETVSAARDYVVALNYGKTGARHGGSSELLSVYVIEGVRTCLNPQLQYTNAETKQCLEPTFVFVVHPELPPGLTMDARTGLITGVPAAALTSSVHVVTIKVPAQGFGGICLGEVPLASCKLVITILPLTSVVVTGMDEDTGVPRLTRSGL